MPMTQAVAQQIAHLLNTQNQLMVPYTAAKVPEYQDQYLISLGPNSKVLGAVEVKKVQWYQCEIDHLSVHPDARGQGIGTGLVQKAKEKASQIGARIAQCTIRVGNKESGGLFTKNGYVATVTFLNKRNGNQVTVYQKVLVPVPESLT
jgi:N-acetylglutamate synthase-like GNAT family acetyltransferase